MKSVLKDIVEHTNSLFTRLRITSDDTQTVIDAINDDKSIVLKAKTKQPIDNLIGNFCLKRLGILNLHLDNPEYNNGTITVQYETKNDIDIPVAFIFENQNGDYSNNFRFNIDNDIKFYKFQGCKWNIDFIPTVTSLQRLKIQVQSNPHQDFFKINTVNNDLIMSFGDKSTHEGSFTFKNNVNGKLLNTLSWRSKEIISILSMKGDISVSLADAGIMKILIDSGLIEYSFFVLSRNR